MEKKKEKREREREYGKILNQEVVIEVIIEIRVFVLI